MRTEIKISAEDVRSINRIEHHYGFKILFCAIESVLAIGGTIAVIREPECIIAVAFFLLFFMIPLSAFMNSRLASACYGTVTEMEHRHTKQRGKFVIPIDYSLTEDGPAPRKFTLGYRSVDAYYCSAEVDGVVLEHIDCDEKLFRKLSAGDRVVVGVYGIVPSKRERKAGRDFCLAKPRIYPAAVNILHHDEYNTRVE